MEIFKLFGSIFVNTDAADESMKKTEKNAENIASKLGSGIKTAAKWGTGLVTAATAATTAITGLAMSVADTAGDIDDAAKRAGTSAEEYQKWAYAAKLGGMEASTLEKAMIKQQKAFADAKEGAKTTAEAYQRLGIDINSISDSGDAFNQVMAALADMEDATTRNAIANDIFGKSYAELAPLLAEGSAGIEALKQEAEDLGGVMSNASVEAGAQLGDTIDQLKTSFGGIVNQLGASVIPIVQQFADLLLQNMPMLQEAIGALAPILADVVSTFLPVITDLAQTLLPIIIDLINQILPVIMEIASAILPVFVQLINTLLPPLMEIIQVALPPLVKIIQSLMPLLSTVISLLTPILELFMSLLAPIIELVAAALEPLITILEELINTALQPLIPIIEVLSKAIEATLGAAIKGLKPVIDGIMQTFGGLIDFITGVFSGNWKKAWGGVVDIFSGIFSGIVNFIKTPINAIISGINSVFSAIGTITIPDWVPLIGGASFSLPQIPMLAKGGDIVESGRVIVGEKGPEILDLPTGARVTPLSGDSAVHGIDYDMLLKTVVEAIRMSIPELERVVQIVPDEDGIFKVVQKKNRENVKVGRPSLA